MEQSLISTSALVVALSSFCMIGFAQTTGTTDLESAFKAAFGKFTQAVVAKDGPQLKTAMAASSYMTMKNMGITHKMDFSKELFDGMGGKLYSGLDLDKLKTLKALETNNTGTLVMLAPKSSKFDPFEMGGDPQAMLLIFKFIRETGVWKYDASSMEPVDDLDEAKLLKGDLSKLNDTRYKPTGIVPPTPAEETAATYDYEAVLNINSFGYEVEVTLNGKVLKKTQGSSAVRTGLKKGENTIVINSTPLDGAYDFEVSVSAAKDGESPVEVFSIKVQKPEPVVTKNFKVNFD